MASVQGEPSLQTLAGRTFAFYPAIRNIEHNEWTYERETWSEFLAVNSRNEAEVWIPRSYLGSVSSADSPVLIVGLNQELEWKAGAVWPYRRNVISMPGPRKRPAIDDVDAPPAPPPPHRLVAGSQTESTIGRMIGAALGVGLLVCLLAILIAFGGGVNPWRWFQGDTKTADQRYLSMTVSDGYHDIAIKIGKPESEQWISNEDSQLQFELLGYESRSYAVVLMGSTRNDARYIGAIHMPSRRILDSVKLPGGGSTAAMLKNLPEF